ncbi:MAG: ribose-5-phosphate isomerase RpiA [Lautropia sp.]
MSIPVAGRPDPQAELKRAVARRALDFLTPGRVVGVGSGSTVAQFIAVLGGRRAEFPRAVSSSERSSALLAAAGIEVVDLNALQPEAGGAAAAGDRAAPVIDVYVDGADEVDPRLALIKGGGGALTREKIIAAASRRFVCIVDASKRVDVLGRFPLPVEVIPMATALVTRQLQALGATVVERAGFVSDNGNRILDASGLRIDDPLALEQRIDGWAGVVTVGLFARRRADVLLVASAGGVEQIEAPAG